MQQHDFEPLHGYVDSILQFFGGIVASVLLYMGVRYQAKKKQKDSVQNHFADERILHNEIARKIQNSTNRIKAVNRLNGIVKSLFAETRADRFLILIAINGTLHYKTVSVIYQLHQEDQEDVDAVKKYENFPIDDSYREMLKGARKFGGVLVKAFEIEETELGHIYMDEKIIQSMVYHVATIPLDKNGKDIMAFVSIATHNEQGFTLEGLNKMRVLMTGQIKKCVMEIIKNEA